MNRKEIQPLRTIIDESYMTENKAYLLSVDEKFQLGYTNVLFCKIGNGERRKLSKSAPFAYS